MIAPFTIEVVRVTREAVPNGVSAEGWRQLRPGPATMELSDGTTWTEAAPGGWRPTHRHRKGGLYRVVTTALIEATLELAVVYDSSDGHVWVRPYKEFHDGRFTELAPATGETDGKK